VSAPASGALGRVTDAVDRIREAEHAAVLLGGAVGLLAAFLHWGGFVLAGALIGLASRSLTRAVAFALAFGVLAWLLFAASLLRSGVFGAYLGMGQLTLLSVAVPVGLPILGAIAVRGVY